MQFESKQARTFWLNFIMGFVPEILVSLALTLAFKGDVTVFVFTLIGLQCLYLLLWIKNSLWMWAVYYLYARKSLVKHLADYLQINHYPEPSDYEKSALGYFETVMSDENQSIDVRLKASGSLAELNLMSSQSTQRCAQLSMAYEEALENHKRTFASAG
jgi:hypothetical protein